MLALCNVPHDTFYALQRDVHVNPFHALRHNNIIYPTSVVPGSAASLVLQPGDVCVSIAGIEVRRWTLENIARLLQTQSGRVKIGIQRRLAADSESQLYDDVLMGPGSVDTASCYARLEGDDEMHPIVCTLANFGAGLPIFSPNENLALPVAIAQPLEYCTRREGFNVTGHALLVTR